MNSTRLRPAAAAAASAALLLVLAACSAPAPAASKTPSTAADGPCAGVTVIVDPGALKVPASAKQTTCVPADGPVAAADVLEKAKVATEGTKQYGDQVVCRVNGNPAADLAISHEGGTYDEKCEGMPAAFAYWSMWVKPADGEWAYAQEGVPTLKLEPGQTLELLFTLDGKPAAPST